MDARQTTITEAAAEAASGVADAAGEATRAAQEVVDAQTVSPRVAVARGQRAERVALAALGGFAAIFLVVRANRTGAFDLAITMKLQRQRIPLLGRLMAIVSWPGFPPQSRIIPAAVIGSMWLLRLRLEAILQTVAWSTGLISSGLKVFMKRPRPVAGHDVRVAAATLGGSSFPSGHVITYVGNYGFLAFLAASLIRPRRWRRAIVGLLAALVGLVGPSRIYQGHHWPTDVLASYLLGTSWLIAVASLYRRLKERSIGD